MLRKITHAATHRARWALAICLLSLAASVASVFATIPTFRQSAQNVIDREQVEQELARARQAKALSEAVDSNKHVIDRLRKKMLVHATQPDVVKNIQDLADKSKLTIKEQKYWQDQDESRNPVLAYAMTAQGDYTALRIFLAYLESKTASLTIVTSLTIQTNSEQDGLLANINLVTYLGRS